MAEERIEGLTKRRAQQLADEKNGTIFNQTLKVILQKIYDAAVYHGSYSIFVDPKLLHVSQMVTENGHSSEQTIISELTGRDFAVDIDKNIVSWNQRIGYI